MQFFEMIHVFYKQQISFAGSLILGFLSTYISTIFLMGSLILEMIKRHYPQFFPGSNSWSFNQVLGRTSSEIRKFRRAYLQL